MPQFEKVINSLFIKDNIDLYITGSNAHFLTDDLATLLDGRYVKMQMRPLSFQEFLSGLSTPMPIKAAYEAYTLFAVLTPPLNGRVWEKNIRQKFIVNCSKKLQ